MKYLVTFLTLEFRHFRRFRGIDLAVIYFAQKNPIKLEILRTLSAHVKIYQIRVIFETTNQFFFQFCITLQCHKTTSLYFFSWNFIYFQQKEPIKVQIWWKFTWAVKRLKLCTLMGFFCHNVSAKKVQKNYFSWHWTVMQSLKKKGIFKSWQSQMTDDSIIFLNCYKTGE